MARGTQSSCGEIFIARNYAIKSIILLDFMDITEIASAAPFCRASENQINHCLTVAYGRYCNLIVKEGAHQIAVRRTKGAQVERPFLWDEVEAKRGVWSSSLVVILVYKPVV
jgi:hypothetical protein